ncbi:MAG: replication-associated recombination protein A [Bacteroidetes bacterium]|nr:replication-associated recombination protein A [Bacteroidota bacterium]
MLGGELDPPADRFAPLAERMRPRTIDDIVGQTHLLGPGKPLRLMSESGAIHSMILWGPPGTGKTTIARSLASRTGAAFFALSAVASGVKELRETIDEARRANARNKKRSILFIDEIHRFSKSQQDALLGAVEDGTVTLIGATTENPSFEVISPLLSRARVYVLEPLGADALREVISHALKNDTELNRLSISFADAAMSSLLALSGGDARKLLSALELSVSLAPRTEDGGAVLTQEIVENAFGRKASRYDKGGEMHYDIISAFIKSMRGSDPNASLYWLARMIEAGEDPEFIARRMIILASEDIGNADPFALSLATSCWQATHAVGWPESRIIFAQCVVYLAMAPKSNASYMAIDAAMADAAADPNLPVPMHLRNAPTKLMKELGYHEGYKYAHSYEGGFTDEIAYLPESYEDKVYYDPKGYGREKQIRERLETLMPKKYKK